MARKDKYCIETELREWFRGAERIVVAGIGNPIRMDDFAGVKIVQDLKGQVSDKVMLIECETVPESFIQQIIDFKPTHILLIDAAILGLPPGASQLMTPDRLRDFPAFSTHMLPLRIFCEYLAGTARAKIALLLIQPKRTDFGEGLTKEMSTSTHSIANVLLRVIS